MSVPKIEDVIPALTQLKKPVAIPKNPAITMTTATTNIMKPICTPPPNIQGIGGHDYTRDNCFMYICTWVYNTPNEMVRSRYGDTVGYVG